MNKVKHWLRRWLEIENYNDNPLRNLISDELYALDRRVDPLYSLTDPVEQNSRLEFILGAISAFESKLGRVEWHWEEDREAMAPPPPVPTKRVWTLRPLDK